jgi:hypothetical protein
MVYMQGSKAARNAASICNRTNICGGVKKGGLGPSIGWFLPNNPNMIGVTQTQYLLTCKGNYSHPTHKYGYHATHTGRM